VSFSSLSDRLAIVGFLPPSVIFRFNNNITRLQYLVNITKNEYPKSLIQIEAIEIEYVLRVEPLNVNVGSSRAANDIIRSLLSLCVRDYCNTDIST